MVRLNQYIQTYGAADKQAPTRFSLFFSFKIRCPTPTQALGLMKSRKNLILFVEKRRY